MPSMNFYDEKRRALSTIAEIPLAESVSFDEDEAQLAAFGKKQQMKRNFRFLSILALNCTVMITWEGFLTTFVIGLVNGGPAGIVYGYLFAWAGNILQILVMAEMVSMIPISGGQYNWIAVLAPASNAKLLSYLAGWTTFVSWQAILASTGQLGGTMIQSLISLGRPSYEPQSWHGLLLYYAIILVALVANTWLSRLLPHVEHLGLAVHLIGYLCVLIPLVALAPHGSAEGVFTTFMNNAAWSTDGLTFFVGLSGAMFAFAGIDAAGHLAEEVESASYAVPTSMVASVLLNGLLGFGMMLALLFCIGDITQILDSQSQFPFVDIFAAATKSVGGGAAMAAIVIVMMIYASIGALTTASRMTWAFARERGLPFHGYLARVDSRNSLPMYAIGASTGISLLLALINVGSTAAFSALVSLTIAASYATFALSASVLLHKRLTVPDSEIGWGRFRLGRAGIPVTVASLAYTAIGIFFSFWPAAPNPSPQTMNWSSLVFAVAVLFSLVYWAVWGRRVYTGPVKEITSDSEQTSVDERSE